MKVSLKVQEQPQNQHHHNHRQPPLLLRAKLLITVFGLPFLSVAAATDPSDLSLSLRTNFLSGPSLKLTYTPATAAAGSPLNVTLRSGVGLFGSPNNSPLVISAHFSLSPQNPNPTPTFSLQIKPRFGDFSLLKTAHSSPPNPRKPNGEVLGFVPLERPVPWKDLNLDSNYKDALLSGILVTAKTTLPVTKTVAVNCRWGVNFPDQKKVPFLTVSKIGMERVCDVKEVEVKKSEGSEGDLELLKGLCVSVRREMEVLHKENREMKQRLAEMRFGKYGYGDGDGGGKKVVAVSENCGEFEQWKSKRSGNGEEPGRREAKKSVNRASDVESELQRAIKAAST